MKTEFENFFDTILGPGALDKSASAPVPAAPVNYGQPQAAQPYLGYDLPKQASSFGAGGVDSPVQQAVVNAVNGLTDQEIQQAEALGYLEAANTVKQANYIKDQLEGVLPTMLTNSEQQAIIDAAYADASAEKSAYVSQAEIQHAINTQAGDLGISNPARKFNQLVQEDALKKLPAHNRPQGAPKTNIQPGISYSPEDVETNIKLQRNKGTFSNAKYIPAKVDAAATGLGINMMNKLPSSAIRKIVQSGHGATVSKGLGYGVPAAAALAAIGGGVAVSKAHARAQQAAVAQSIGQKVLGHLKRHGLKYGIGAGAAGLLAAKSASDEVAAGELYMQAFNQASEELQGIDKSASEFEAWYDTLGVACYNEQLPEEIKLYQQAVMQSGQVQ